MKSSFQIKGIGVDILKTKMGYKAVEHKTQLLIPGCSGIENKREVRLVVDKALSKFNEKKMLKIVEDGMKQLKWKEFFTSEETEAKFTSYFGVSLRMFRDTTMYFMLGRYTFDVIGFDKWLQTPDGVSTKDYVAKKYGEKACAFIKKLIKEDL